MVTNSTLTYHKAIVCHAQYDSWASGKRGKGLQTILYVHILTSSYHGFIITLPSEHTLNHFPRRDKPNSHAAPSLTERFSSISCVPLRCSALICVWSTFATGSVRRLPLSKVDQMRGMNSMNFEKYQNKKGSHSSPRFRCMGSPVHLFRGLLKGDINGSISEI